MNGLSRRDILLGAAASAAALGMSAAASAATFGNPDSPPEGRINGKSRTSLDDPGPQNPALANQFPSFQDPPATDINGMPLFWASFNNAHRRYQNGGWARQVTQEDFAISEDISGVNMRLAENGIREMHWHQQAEWAIMLDGKCRITILDELGRPQVADVKTGALWYFPPGLPPSLQGLGSAGAEFLLAFDNGRSSEFNTLLLTDWIAHTPPEVLAKNFGLPEEAFKNIPVHNKWIYQSKLEQPAPPLAEVEAQMASAAGKPPNPFVFNSDQFKTIHETKSGSVRLADSTNFLVSKTIAATRVTIKPGGLRAMHWHPNADEWLYILKGSGRATVFNTGPAAITADFHAGDIGLIRKALVTTS